MKLKRPLYGPHDPRGPSRGRDVRDFVKRSLHRVETNFFPKPPGGFDDVYNAKTVEAVTMLQRANGIDPTGNMGAETFDLLWTQYADAYAKWAYRTWSAPKPLPSIPDLGPFVEGEPSVLDHDLTHATGGFPTVTHRTKFPAFDGGFRAGKKIIAPEPLRVYRASSASRRDGRPNGKAFYARGVSGIEYWVGHTTDVPPISLKARLTLGRAGPLVPKGAFLTTVSANHEAPHGHFAIDATALLGYDLAHRTDYSHGAPTVREQLEKALA